MTDSAETALDRAHAAMAASPDDAAARLTWYHAFADAELTVLLERELRGNDLDPRIFPLEEGLFLLAFDGDGRLGAFAGSALPYAALPGRVLVALLTGKGVGIAVNPGDEARAFLMPPDAVDWLAALLAERPRASDQLPGDWSAPEAPGLAARLAGRLEGLGVPVSRGWLARGGFEDRPATLLLVFEDAAPDARAALAKAAGEALAFSGTAADVVFVTAAQSAALGLPGFADPVPLRAPAPPTVRSADSRTAPGTDPDRPPRLR